MAENKKTAGETAMEVYTFNPNNALVRVQVINEEPWFVAKDICDALGIGNITDTMGRLDDDEKLTSVVSKSGQNRQMWMVNESGLYNLIFQSRKAEAKAFRRWVTSEVLPMIRRTGRYELAAEPVRGRRRKVVPRDRSEEMRAFYAELGKWVLKEDVLLVAGELGLKEGTVRSALRGTGSNLKVLELLVPLAAGNREAGRRSDIGQHRPGVTSAALEQLRKGFMFMSEEGGAR